MAKRILFVFGTRPEVIKMAPVVELARKTKTLQPVICVTAQHRYLLDQALAEFDIEPDIDLDLMRPRQSLEEITSRVMCGMRRIYRRVRPQLVLVQGDTSTVFAAALAAYYEGIDVDHIEAGLRSGNLRNPFPEEINRRFVALVARYNFCPTKGAKNNLLRENVDPKKVFVTGNTVVDALKRTLKLIGTKELMVAGVSREFLDSPFVLITGHRRENFGTGMKDLCRTIKALALKYKTLRWLWTVHLNPQAREVVFATLKNMDNVRLIEPPTYREFVYLMRKAQFIISDSGGVQEEAPSLGKQVLVTRICTERAEALASGTSVLVGTDPARISHYVSRFLEGVRCVCRRNPFGDGNAARRIIDVIIKGKCQPFR
jgi:UDP-N-acetylglucosamine 2-epimerase (non-hydrolysing)